MRSPGVCNGAWRVPAPWRSGLQESDEALPGAAHISGLGLAENELEGEILLRPLQEFRVSQMKLPAGRIPGPTASSPQEKVPFRMERRNLHASVQVILGTVEIPVRQGRLRLLPMGSRAVVRRGGLSAPGESPPDR
jgi:hypothetical protein